MSRDQLAQRLGAVARLGVDRRRVRHRLADVAEMIVHRVGQQVDLRRLPLAGQHQAAAAMGVEVLGHGRDPFFQ